MPATISLHLVGVWFCVGLFVGMGWAAGHWVVGKIAAAIDAAFTRT